MKKIIKVDLTLTTQSPLSIKLPTPQGLRENKWDGAPVMTRGLNADGEAIQTAYIPATTLRGSARRAMAIPLMEKAAAEGKAYTLQDAYKAITGQDAASETAAETINLADARTERQKEINAVADLFGCGLNMASRLKMSNLMPEIDVLPEAFGVVKKDIDDTEGAVDLLDDENQQAFYARSSANQKRSAAAAIVSQIERKLWRDKDNKDLKSALADAQAQLKKYEDEMGGMKVSSKNLASFYALPAGVEWKGFLIIDNPRETDVGVIRTWLETLSQYPLLGGNQARGCGHVKMVATIKVDGKIVETIETTDFDAAKVSEVVQAAA
ncbi:hypothetical protein [Sulfitobacter sp. R18_1]|uniref:hypothetical protein n=1 Tax=Sulfitobacter sp. R18_1 TaxID=2821104 RepID=UPI001ADABD2C|nr:hypothetical protein [Sulfitobacter sp. R18_1]MBO9427906.1 hypothetical protein [Sulfitobacter sp. R18_1]